jgi:hypothetical protein
MAEGLLMCCMIELTSVVVQEGGKQYLQHRKEMIESGHYDELLSSRIKAAKHRAAENMRSVSPIFRKSFDNVYQRMSHSSTPDESRSSTPSSLNADLLSQHSHHHPREAAAAAIPSAESQLFPSIPFQPHEKGRESGKEFVEESKDVSTELKSSRPLSRRLRDSFGHFSDFPKALKRPAQFLSNISPLRLTRSKSETQDTSSSPESLLLEPSLFAAQDLALVASVENIIPPIIKKEKPPVVEDERKRETVVKTEEPTVPSEAKELTEFEKFIGDIMVFVKEEYELQKQNPDSVLLKQKQYHDKLLRNLAEIRLKNF